jgi:hypothetical protein
MLVWAFPFGRVREGNLSGPGLARYLQGRRLEGFCVLQVKTTSPAWYSQLQSYLDRCWSGFSVWKGRGRQGNLSDPGLTWYLQGRGLEGFCVLNGCVHGRRQTTRDRISSPELSQKGLLPDLMSLWVVPTLMYLRKTGSR